jgi:hypothetical protein
MTKMHQAILATAHLKYSNIYVLNKPWHLRHVRPTRSRTQKTQKSPELQAACKRGVSPSPALDPDLKYICIIKLKKKYYGNLPPTATFKILCQHRQYWLVFLKQYGVMN